MRLLVNSRHHASHSELLSTETAPSSVCSLLSSSHYFWPVPLGVCSTISRLQTGWFWATLAASVNVQPGWFWATLTASVNVQTGWFWATLTASVNVQPGWFWATLTASVNVLTGWFWATLTASVNVQPGWFWATLTASVNVQQAGSEPRWLLQSTSSLAGSEPCWLLQSVWDRGTCGRLGLSSSLQYLILKLKQKKNTKLLQFIVKLLQCVLIKSGPLERPS